MSGIINIVSGEYGFYHQGNNFLGSEGMTVNAQYIARALSGYNVTRSALAGMLANMQVESTINPAIWENCTVDPDLASGYGLVQWTPASKYINWCTDQGLDPASMDSALARIKYEVENGLQWIASDAYPCTFKEFLTTSGTPYDKAMTFMYNYERPADLDQPLRGEYAQTWYELLTDLPEDVTPDAPTSKTKKKMPLWLLITASRRN